MKALVIYFNGEYKSEKSKDEALMLIASTIGAAITESDNIIKMSELDDVSVAKALTKYAVETESEPLSAEQEIENFCKAIDKEIGRFSMYFDMNAYKRAFARLILDPSKDFIKRYHIAIKQLLLSNKQKYRDLLVKYSLADLPEYLREINSILKIM